MQHFLERQAQEMQEKASALSDAFATAGATVSSSDGSVTVTVAPNGALSKLQLGNRACELGPARLTTAIMDTVRKAQSQTAHSVASSMEAIVGGGESLDMVKSFLPPDPLADDDEVDQNKFVEEPEPPPAAPSPPPPIAPPTGPAPRRRTARDEDEDGGNPW